MITAWMLYVLVAGALLAVAGRAFEEVARLRGLPTRWAWLAALVLVPVLGAIAPLRETAPLAAGRLAAGEEGVATATSPATAARPAGPLPVAPDRRGPFSGDVLIGALTRAPRLVQGLLVPARGVESGPVGLGLALGWLALSVLMATAGAATLVRSSRMRRGWPLGEVAGARVRIAPWAGPAVAGLVRSEIVIPRWLASAPEPERRLAVVHEREHQRARDPYILALGYLALCLVPWHPAVWWMHRRLRLAVEVDCDRRVLRRGVCVRAYGSFLIDVAGRDPGPAALPAAAGLSAGPPMLERRLQAMTRPLPRLALPRALAATTLGAAVVFTACEARLPTGAELDAMDVARAEAALEQLRVRVDDDVRYFVDGVELSAEEARVLSPEVIARIDVAARAEGRPAMIRLTTRPAGADADDAPEVGVAPEVGITRERVPGDGPADRPAGVTLRAVSPDTTPPPPLAHGFDGLLLVDGERVDAARLRDLDRARIERIEILKGPAATRLFAEPEAARGVILITTRR